MYLKNTLIKIINAETVSSRILFKEFQIYLTNSIIQTFLFCSVFLFLNNYDNTALQFHKKKGHTLHHVVFFDTRTI